MFCLSPIIDKNLDLIPPFDVQVLFIMDNMKIRPDHDIFIIVNDPIYYPFEDSIQQINSTNIVQFEVYEELNVFFLIIGCFVFFKRVRILLQHIQLTISTYE
jgi:hypothetical protein